MNITGRLIEMQETDRRNDYLIIGIENEAGFNLPDELRNIDQTLDLVELEYLGHQQISLDSFFVLSAVRFPKSLLPLQSKQKESLASHGNMDHCV
jgi:hypothetical protein